MTDPEKMRPDAGTRAEEQTDAQVTAGADRPPTDEEARLAEDQEEKATEQVAAHEREMAERGANQKGEGRIT